MDYELIETALPGLRAASPMPISVPPYSPTSVWNRLLPRASGAIIHQHGTDAGPVLVRWLRQAARHKIDAATPVAT